MYENLCYKVIKCSFYKEFRKKMTESQKVEKTL